MPEWVRNRLMQSRSSQMSGKSDTTSAHFSIEAPKAQLSKAPGLLPSKPPHLRRALCSWSAATFESAAHKIRCPLERQPMTTAAAAVVFPVPAARKVFSQGSHVGVVFGL